MQNTRLNRIVDTVLERSFKGLQNPWRRISLLLISILFGNFLATASATISGQNADWDVVLAAVLVALIELLSWVVYRSPRSREQQISQPRLVLETLNGIKIGAIYGFLVEAFKLGS